MSTTSPCQTISSLFHSSSYPIPSPVTDLRRVELCRFRRARWGDDRLALSRYDPLCVAGGPSLQTPALTSYTVPTLHIPFTSSFHHDRFAAVQLVYHVICPPVPRDTVYTSYKQCLPIESVITVRPRACYNAPIFIFHRTKDAATRNITFTRNPNRPHYANRTHGEAVLIIPTATTYPQQPPPSATLCKVSSLESN